MLPFITELTERPLQAFKQHTKSSYTPEWVSPRESLIETSSKNGWMPKESHHHPSAFIKLLTHFITLFHTYMHVHTYTPNHAFMYLKTPTPTSHPLLLYLAVTVEVLPFPYGLQPSTHSTLAVCDPWMCWKRKHLTSWPFLLEPSHPKLNMDDQHSTHYFVWEANAEEIWQHVYERNCI